jgi:2-keto-3-deoxy-L-rhamnonate aldolase RhmA
MELEAVGRVAVRDHGLKVCGQIYDVDGVEGTFLGADAAADAKTFGDEGDAGVRSDFDTKLAGSDDRT